MTQVAQVFGLVVSGDNTYKKLGNCAQNTAQPTGTLDLANCTEIAACPGREAGAAAGQSWRRATIGSTRAARPAGMEPAPRATRARTMPAPTRTPGS